MSKLTPTSKAIECEICGDSSGKCRVKDDLRLCMSTTDKYSAPNGFRFIGTTKDGLWGQFLPQQDAPERSRDELLLRRKQRQAEAKQQQQEKIARELSLEDRAAGAAKLIQQLSLAPADRQDLIDRLQNVGLDDAAIEQFLQASGIVSAGQWQSVAGLPDGFPGLYQGFGRSSLLTQQGYLIPCFTVDGQISGFQVRMREQPEEGGRYRWLSSLTKKNPKGATPHINGELPIQVARPVSGASTPFIGMAEGTLKPMIAAEVLGHVVVGAAGGNFHASRKQLRKALKHLSKELRTKTIRFFPDGGAAKNPHVLRQYRKNWKLLEKWGYEIQIGWWGQFEKEHGDIDEVSSEQRQAIAFISVADFNSLAGSTGRLKGSAQELKIQKDLNSLRIAPTRIFSDRYLPSGHLPKAGGIQLVDAPMGVGKTYSWLAGIVQEHRAKFPDANIYVLGSRNLLLYQTCQDLGISHIHWQVQQKFGRKHQSFALCYDSIGQIPPESIPPNSLLILDEIEQGFDHLLRSDTIGAARPFVIERARQVFNVLARLGGFIVGLEDGVTNCSLDLIQDMTGLKDADVEVYRSDWKAKGNRTYTVYSSQDGLKNAILEHVKKGEAIDIPTDSAKFGRETEQRLLETGIPAESILRLDSTTSQEQWAKEFAQNPNQWLAENPQIKILIHSPSLQAGSSVTDSRFTAVAFYLVKLAARDTKQLVERLRTDVPRFGWINDTPSVGSFDPEQLLDDLYRNTEGIAKLTSIAEHLAKIESVQAGESIALGAKLAQMLDRNDPNQVFWLKHWARFQARENFGRANRTALLTDFWRERGHNVVEIKSRLADEERAIEKAERQRIREGLERKDADFFAAIEVSHHSRDSAEMVLNDRSATHEQRQEAIKFLMQDSLPGCDFNNADFAFKVVFHDGGSFRRGAELLWAIQNPDKAQHIDRLSLAGKVTRAARFGEVVWTPALRLQSLKANLISRSPLMECITGEVYTNESEQVKKFHQWVEFNRDEVWRVVRLKPGSSPVETTNKFLKKIGYVTEEVQRKGSRGDRQRGYQIVNLEDCDRDRILAALDEKFQVKHGQIQERLMESQQQQGFEIGDRIELLREIGGAGTITELPSPRNLNCFVVQLDSGLPARVFPEDSGQMKPIEAAA